MDLRTGDALDVLRSLPDASVNLIATDPPYFRVKGEAWDNAWRDAPAFIAWLGTVADEWQRVLAPNGTLYCFASPQMAARVQVMLADRFTVLNEVVWVKSNGWHMKADAPTLRGYFPQTERIVVAEQFGADGSALRGSGYDAACAELHAGVFEPLRQYLVGELKASGVSRSDIDDACGTANVSQYWWSGRDFIIPTAERWSVLQWLAPQNFRREYEDLRREYEDLRRPFNVTAEVPYTDVWTYPTVPPGRKGERRHPCAKPLDMMRHIVTTSSRPGDVVLDCFLGSGSTAVAARDLGREFIGCDMDGEWVDHTHRRLAQVAALPQQLTLDEGIAA